MIVSLKTVIEYLIRDDWIYPTGLYNIQIHFHIDGKSIPRVLSDGPPMYLEINCKEK